MTDSNLVANAVVAQSSSQFISIVPENGEQFNPGQKIIYNIEPEIGYIKRDSYLVFDVVNNSTNQCRYTFQKTAGAHAMIDRVDIYSKETGILLETTTNYAQFINIENQYLKDSHNKEQTCEGVGTPVQSWVHSINASGTITSKRALAGPHEIPNNKLSPVGEATTNGGAPRFTTRRFLVPLKVGLFGHFDSQEKLIPVANFGGLRIEITLQSANLALERLGLRVKSKDALEDAHSTHFDFKDKATTLDKIANVGDVSGTRTVVMNIDLGAGNGLEDPRDSGLVAGNRVQIQLSNASGVQGGVIQTVVGADNANVVYDNREEAIPQTLRIQVQVDGANAIVGASVPAETYIVVDDNAPNYKVMATEFRLLQIVPPPNVADSLSKGINYEFTSYEVFLDNVPSSSLRHQVPINSVASKALALFTVLYPSDTAEPSEASGPGLSVGDYYHGIIPTTAKLNEVQYFINNRLYPLRAYNPQARADKCLALNEVVKAFKAIGKEPLALGNADYAGLDDYTFTPLIARELARSGMVFDIRNAEPELRLKFSGTRSAQGEAGILRANTYVFSKKIIQTSPTGVQVIH